MFKSCFNDLQLSSCNNSCKVMSHLSQTNTKNAISDLLMSDISSAKTSNNHADELLFNKFVSNYDNEDHIKSEVQHKFFSNTQYEILNISIINNQLKTINNKLNDNILFRKWNDRKVYCDNLRTSITAALEKISHNSSQFPVKDIKTSTNMKKQKKKRHHTWIKKKEISDNRKKNLLIKINTWLNEKKYEIDAEKAAENIRKNADVILYDVRTKRTDTKRFLLLLRELKNLRKIKVTFANAKEQIYTSEADKVFNNIIVNLLRQWMALDKEYFLEEKGLKLMVKKDVKKQFSKNEMRTILEWINLLFQNDQTFTNAEKGLKPMILLRLFWDHFIDINEGSKIPIGWIIPPKPSIILWAEYATDS